MRFLVLRSWKVLVGVTILLGCSADEFTQASIIGDSNVDSSDPVTSDSGTDVFTLDGQLTDSQSDSLNVDTSIVPDTSLNCGAVSQIPKLCSYDTCLAGSGYSCSTGYGNCIAPIDVYCYKPSDCSVEHCCYNDNVVITSCMTTVSQFQSTSCHTTCPKSILCLVDGDCGSGQKCYPVKASSPSGWSFGICQ